MGGTTEEGPNLKYMTQIIWDISCGSYYDLKRKVEIKRSGELLPTSLQAANQKKKTENDKSTMNKNFLIHNRIFLVTIKNMVTARTHCY